MYDLKTIKKAFDKFYAESQDVAGYLKTLDLLAKHDRDILLALRELTGYFAMVCYAAGGHDCTTLAQQAFQEQELE